MILDRLKGHHRGGPDAAVRQARKRVVQKLTELIYAAADALEAERPKGHLDPVGIQPLLQTWDDDPGLIRGFVDTPIYAWVTHNYVTGNTDDHLLCKIVEILHELAPRVFRRPQY